MTLRINPLTYEEERELKKLSVYDQRGRWRLRAKIMLELDQGALCPAVATRLKCHVSTVRRWLKRWNHQGLVALAQADHWADQSRLQKRQQALKLIIQQDPTPAGITVYNLDLSYPGRLLP